ncbi:MAG: SOS response-associated peptidase [Rhizobiaceae bacterium]|nr:SOS response-associated peptidase [Rhizobiaceae bacterium]
MCNDYEQHIAWAEYEKAVRHAGLAVATHQGAVDLPSADDIRIGDLGPVMRLAGDAVELSPMAFGLPPRGKATGKGAPVFNFRSEGRSFAQSRRCIVPASAFFEFTGKKSPKAKHRFAFRDGPLTAIAAIWSEGSGNQPPAFAMLTTEPGADVKPYHDRQVVVLAPGDWTHWLDLTKPEAELLKPSPAGTLLVETVRPGSD